MPRLAVIFFSLFLSLNLQAQENQREFQMNDGDTTFTMKRYVLGLLMAGPNRDQDSAAVIEIQDGHLHHLNTLSKSGKLIVAGPFQDGGEYRGILIFDVETIEEAIQLQKEDPAIKSGRLEHKVFYWWGAKGTYLK